MKWALLSLLLTGCVLERSDDTVRKEKDSSIEMQCDGKCSLRTSRHDESKQTVNDQSIDVKRP